MTASWPTRERLACLCLGLDHAKVELVLVFEGGLFAQFLDPVLLGVEVPRSLDIVLVLLEVTESFPMRGLGSFPGGMGTRGQLHTRERESRGLETDLCCLFCSLSLSLVTILTMARASGSGCMSDCGQSCEMSLWRSLLPRQFVMVITAN